MSENMANRLRRQVYAKKFTGYVILVAIGMVFVFFGYSGRGNLGLSGIGSVARVNDTLISAAEFQSEEARTTEYFSNMFGGAMDLSGQRNLLRQQALESLIRSELVVQAARKAGIYSTDAEVRDFIVKGIPAFQENGQFQRERYMGYLQAVHSSPGEFEERVRKDIANLRTRHLVELAARPTTLESAKTKELRGAKMNVAFARLDAEELAKGMKVSESEATTKLADADFAKRAETFFNDHKADWGRPETVKAQHILIAAKAGDAAAEKAALEKATAARARVQKEDFGKVAGALSDDPGSKAKKGLLEPFGRGRMVKEFEEAAFALKPGQISEPVKSQFGYHIIKVLEHDPGKNPTFADVKGAVAQRLMARDRAETALSNLEQQVSKGDFAAAEEALKSVNATWEETGSFDLSADVVPRVPSGPVADAVFEVSQQKPFLNRVIHEGGARYVLKFKSATLDPATASASSGGEASPETLQRQRADGIYNSWLTQFREVSRVETNPEVFRQ